MRKKIFWIAPLAILAMVLFVIVGGELVKLLWNWLLPGLFGWRLIRFWQAVGLLALCRILFGGFRFRGPRRYDFRRRMRERWENMTPEERERLRQRWQERCGGFEPPQARTAP
jgi:hypothetical protein